MDAELTDPLGRLTPNYTLGTELVIPRGGGTGSNIKDSDIAETLANRPNLFGTTQEQVIDDAVKAARGIRAYHGSPHEFEQFDTSKIGTGVGEQAYGHGLYFTEHEPTAINFRDNTTKSKNLRDFTKHRLLDFGGEFEPQMKGHMYEVNIDAHPDHFLDWYKPLNEQSEYVQNLLKKIKLPDFAKIDNSYFGKDIANAVNFANWNKLKNASPEIGSKFLSNVGIKGITYTDVGNWEKDKDPIRNYVVFDPKDIEIMRRYARGGDVIAMQTGGRTMGNNAIDNAIRVARLSDDQIDMPHSLKELQDWKKTHSSHKADMDKAFSSKMSGVEGAEPIAMPADLDELLAYLRSHHASGGRAAFGFGGDSDVAEGSTYSGNISHEAEAPSRNESINAFQGRQSPEQRDYNYSGRGIDDMIGGGRGSVVEQPGERAQYMQGQDIANQMVSDRFGFGSATGTPYAGLGEGTPLFQAAGSPYNLSGLQPMSWQRMRAEQALGKFTGAESDDQGSAYNPTTGAFGRYQLLPSTALSVLKQNYPELTYRQSQAQPNPADLETGGVWSGAGQIPLSKQEQLRSVLLNQGLQKDIATTLTEQNLKSLSSQGIQPTDANLYAAHFLGAGTAANVLNADPSTPLTSLVGEAAINANPQLANMTAGDFAKFTQNAVAQGGAGSRTASAGYGVYAGGAGQPTPGSIVSDATQDVSTPSQSKEIPLLMNAGLAPALNRARIAELENQGLTQLGREYELTDANGNVISPKEWYRQDMERQLNRPVSMDEVKSGIVNEGGQQLVNYALRDPETAILGALMPGAGLRAVMEKLFGSKTGDQQVSDAVNIARGDRGGRDQQQAMTIPQAPVTAPAPYTTELSAGNLALPSTTGMTAEQWASANTGGDLSKVHARIKYVNGAPMLDYYTV